MTYEEARAFIGEANQYGSKLGLETVTELLRRLDNPQERLRIIHVGGTNGKGSTSAFIASILAAEGYLTGRYNSPSVFSYREKIRLSFRGDYNVRTHRQSEVPEIYHEEITKKGVGDAAALIKAACEAMVRDGFPHPTSFEIETAMAYLYLAEAGVDYAVIEVGMGGRLDATNTVNKPVCSVITSVSMDHMQFLGDTLKKITAEKAGIIKKGVPAVTCNKDPEVLQVLYETARQSETRLILADISEAEEVRYTDHGTAFYYRGEEYKLQLLGEYQMQNALLAIRTAEVLREEGCKLSDAAIKAGLLQAKWSGRLEILAREPLLVVDGAHNEDAAVQLRKAVELYFKDRRILFILGVLADKDYTAILRIMAPLAQVIITVTPDNPRALEASRLAEEAAAYCPGRIVAAGSTLHAVNTAYELAEKEDVILAFGSLSYLREIKRAVSTGD